MVFLCGFIDCFINGTFFPSLYFSRILRIEWIRVGFEMEFLHLKQNEVHSEVSSENISIVQSSVMV